MQESNSLYRVVWDYKPVDINELRLDEGAIIYVVNKCTEDWWEGKVVGTNLVGVFPANHVEIVDDSIIKQQSLEKISLFTAGRQESSPISEDENRLNPQPTVVAYEEQDKADEDDGSLDDNDKRRISLTTIPKTCDKAFTNATASETLRSHTTIDMTTLSDYDPTVASPPETDDQDPFRDELDTMPLHETPIVENTMEADRAIMAVKAIHFGDHDLHAHSVYDILPTTPLSMDDPNCQKTHEKDGLLMYRKSGTLSKSWKPMHVSLRQGCIFVRRNDGKSRHGVDDTCELPIMNIESLRENVDEKRFTLVVTGSHQQSMEEHHFQAASIQECESWVYVLLQLVGGHGIGDKPHSKEKPSRFIEGISRFHKWASHIKDSRPKKVEGEIDDDKKSGRMGKFKTFFSAGNVATRDTDLVEQQNALFGVELAKRVEQEGSDVPYILKSCLAEIERRGLESVGIYRLSGNSRDIQRLKLEFSQGNVDLEKEPWCDEDINTITSVVKSYLRELPIPLTTYEFYPEFMRAVQVPNYAERLSSIKEAVHHLPHAYFITLKYLVYHLIKVTESSEINKMGVSGLAIVFGPTLMRSEDSIYAAMMNMGMQNATIEIILGQYDWIFDESHDRLDVPEITSIHIDSPTDHSPSSNHSEHSACSSTDGDQMNDIHEVANNATNPPPKEAHNSAHLFDTSEGGSDTVLEHHDTMKSCDTSVDMDNRINYDSDTGKT